MISYTKRGEKYVFLKDGVCFALTKDQIAEMKKLFSEIEGDRNDSTK